MSGARTVPKKTPTSFRKTTREPKRQLRIPPQANAAGVQGQQHIALLAQDGDPAGTVDLHQQIGLTQQPFPVPLLAEAKSAGTLSAIDSLRPAYFLRTG